MGDSSTKRESNWPLKSFLNKGVYVIFVSYVLFSLYLYKETLSKPWIRQTSSSSSVQRGEGKK